MAQQRRIDTNAMSTTSAHSRGNWMPFRTLVTTVLVLLLCIESIHGKSPRTWGRKLPSNYHSGKNYNTFHHQTNTIHDSSVVWKIPRGGDAVLETAAAAAETLGTEALGTTESSNLIVSVLQGLISSIANGPKGDALVLLATTALNTPLCQAVGLSPILGFLFWGILFGPNGLGLIHNVHQTEVLADLGIVLFLFEMGIHLSIPTLMRMRKTVFGLGGSQFAITAVVVAVLAATVFGMSPAAATILGGGLALSSSAFVLQLLKDKKQLGTVYGESSFGVLLLQDLMVVPLLVVTPLLAGTGGGIGKALVSALLQLTIALAGIGLVGKYAVTPVYDWVAKAQSQEALVGLILLNVLGMSFFTEGLGLSNTLGPFLAGVLLAENPHVHHIEQEASPIRGILVGLFFFTVGFEMDLKLIFSNFGLVTLLVGGLLILKTAIASAVGQKLGGLDVATSRRLGLVLSQGGEFAFVAFRTARSYGILDERTTKLLLTVVSLTMACTPTLEGYGASLMDKQQQQQAATTVASSVPEVLSPLLSAVESTGSTTTTTTSMDGTVPIETEAVTPPDDNGEPVTTQPETVIPTEPGDDTKLKEE